MKMYQKSLKLVAVVFLFAMAAFVISCKKDADPFSGEVNQTVNNESTQDAQQDEVDDMASNQLNANDQAGRVVTTDDGRVSCAKITITNGDLKGSGTLVIDFNTSPNGTANANGCTDAKGNVRKGKITVVWAGGRWFKNGAAYTITLDGYSINGVLIDGTRTLTNVTNAGAPLLVIWNIVASHTSTWPDGTTASRTVHKTRQWDVVGGKITVTQTGGTDSAATGTNRHGTSYTVTITQGLVYDIACAIANKVYIPISGTKVIVFDSKTVTIDFGSGTCDNTFTVSFDGKSKSISAKNDSSND